MILIYKYLLPPFTPEWTVWLACYFSFGMGAGLGTGAIRWPKYGVLTLGAVIGYVLGVMIDLVIIQSFVDQQSVANIITILIVIVIAMVFSVIFYDYAVIVCCCMIGSYVLFRGISMFMGGYPTEKFLYTVINEGDVRDIRATFWVYLSFMIVGFVGSMSWQLYHRQKNVDLYNYRG
jgi:hypothetical protein